MARKRYIGPAEAVTVVAAGYPLGHVKKGDVLEVPDDLAALVAWPETLWQNADDEPKAKAAKAKG